MQVTIIFSNDISLELQHVMAAFPQNGQGRVTIPESFKKGKSIIAVCEGEINIMNKFGECIATVDAAA
jgi:uncharacterized protein (TIGR02922 family)